MFYLMVVVTTSALCINASPRLPRVLVSCLVLSRVFRSQIQTNFPNFITSVRVRCQCVTSKYDVKGGLLLLLLLLLRDLSGRTARCFARNRLVAVAKDKRPCDN